MKEIVLTNVAKADLIDLFETSFKEFIKQHQNFPNDDAKTYSELLTIQDLVKLFGVSKVTIHNWKKKGLLPFYKMGRRVFFKKSEVLDSMNQKKRKLEVSL